MNYGYLPPNDRSHLRLESSDEPDRFCIQLYQSVVASIPLADARVLEVGSGRGGGASYLARYRQLRKMTGVDYSSEAVSFCQKRYRDIANLEFSVGDAERLPFPDNSFDVVVNVESSHCYGDISKFFREVVRVLRPGGYFAFADLRGADEMSELKKTLQVLPWKKLEEEDITANVAAALQADDRRKRELITELVSPRLRPIFAEFAGVEGGKVFRGLTNRDLLYFRFVFQKRG